ncbi:winged helix-turn-helix transcriptional regulator [Mesorhizobium sp. B3-1-3]|uniref:MarR family winged helix-turn-helix transcriptional regulator n=1 Tax=unclassified Mesorhizobium TaxID=325217 RepID=UPI00112ABF31|nr:MULTISPECIES: MarR family winged helix-turn-helix transcriptional regulator [unclassified Mesorhizobium]TPI56056.1 winged helix-turn-helix transcriptional regulator [Mesorhizobium sp. B3-1-8]TPI63350.1 winged helix-turn-helix transcriptional regulator [Mesorhizobium sp. B3-1-3]
MALPDLPDEMFLVTLEDDDSSPRSTLSFSRSPTVLLTFAANRFTRAAARVYQERYGIGAMDWRMLVMLTREPGATVTRSADTIGIDKAAVSRCLQRLLGMGFVSKGLLHSNGRSRGWRLTDTGHALHKTILKEALRRQRHLFSGFSPEEVQSFCYMLTRFLDNLADLQASPSPTSEDDGPKTTS